MTKQTESPAVTRARLVEAMEWADYQAALCLNACLGNGDRVPWLVESARLRHAIAVHDREQLERYIAESAERQTIIDGIVSDITMAGAPKRKTKRTSKRKA